MEPDNGDEDKFLFTPYYLFPSPIRLSMNYDFVIDSPDISELCYYLARSPRDTTVESTSTKC